MALDYPFWVNDFDRVKDHRINYPLYSKIFEAELPMKPNSYSINDKIKCIWLGPNEWLIIHDKKELFPILNPYMKDKNLIIFMGAGSITNWARDFITQYD